MKKWISIFILLAAVSALFAKETIRIDKIIDCNLYQLKDGRKISLVNVGTPSLTDTSRTARRVSREIMAYCKAEMRNFSLSAEFVAEDEKTGVWRVHLMREYDLNTKNFNEHFLENGFGFYQEKPRTEYSESYFKAAQKAYKNNAGVFADKNEMSLRTNRMDRRWRILGGYAFDLEDIEGDEDHLPIVSFGYRISRLLTLLQSGQSTVSLAAGFETFIIIIQNVYLGPEIRIQRWLSLSYHAGVLAMFVPWLGEGDYLSSYQSVNVGLIFEDRNFEFETGLMFGLEGGRMLRTGICITF
ncbi:hypothetical protein JW948_13885 [bacterium]|nr:hypothetical protein [bacterium]